MRNREKETDMKLWKSTLLCGKVEKGVRERRFEKREMMPSRSALA
jgi:hypothetical protein